jgi:probable blue pigment (indigoidine) exporter
MTGSPSPETRGSDPRLTASGPGDSYPAKSTAGSGRQDILLLILLGALWGSAFPVIRVGIVAGAPPLIFAAVRYALTAGFLVPIAILLRARIPPRSQLVPAAVFGGVLIIGLYGGLLYLGEQSTSGGLAAVLAASASFWSVLFGYALLPGERFGREEMIGLVIGFVGVGVLVLPDLGTGPTTTLVGAIFVLVAVISFAAGGVLLRRTVAAEPTLWTLATQFAVAAALVGVMAAVLGEPRALGNTSVTLPALAYLVVVPSILGYVLYFRLHHRVGPSRANLVVYVGPVVAVMVGFLLFGEKVTAIEIGGMALIVAGLYIVHRGRLTKKG